MNRDAENIGFGIKHIVVDGELRVFRHPERREVVIQFEFVDEVDRTRTAALSIPIGGFDSTEEIGEMFINKLATVFEYATYSDPT